MSQEFRQIWDAASSHPFSPSISKDAQFSIAITLFLVATILSGVFALSMSILLLQQYTEGLTRTDRSFIALPVLGLPAALAFGYVSLSLFLPPNLQADLSLPDLAQST
jgi:uncharacterized BrkB/YihY/UPF0761 family membrane protein